jgi:hypothetical protein
MRHEGTHRPRAADKTATGLAVKLLSGHAAPPVACLVQVATGRSTDPRQDTTVGP